MLLAGPMMAKSEADAIPTDGLVAWYTMDNISGTTLFDETGSYNGTISGATDGGGYLSFDGIDDYVSIAGMPDLGTSGSIVFQVKVTSIAGGIIGGHPSTGASDRAQIGIFGTDFNGAFTSNNYQSPNLASGIGSLGLSYIIIMYWDATNVYIDINDTNYVTYTYSGTPDTNNSSWYLGGNGPGSALCQVDIYEKIVYSKTLSSEERTQINAAL